MGITLEQLTWANVFDVVDCSEDSYTPHYPLPRTVLEADRHMGYVEELRMSRVLEEYVAYSASDGERRLVGGGQLMSEAHRFTIGYWVVSALGRRGIGTAIAGLLEAQARIDFPREKSIQAHIDPDNVGSRKLASVIGYTLTDAIDEKGLLIYRKSL